MKSSAISSEPVNVGFQIAPMIDVVFVIMLFFMVMANSVKMERHLSFGLPAPGPIVGERPALPPTELDVVIAEDGMVMMNEEQYDAVGQKAMPLFTAALQRISADAVARGDKVLVTIRAEEQASYERIIDVMNAMSKAKLANVTFAVGEE
ncbi:outer membrane transport energization protein ExbD [Roseimicrobium gellanilyticum]|uniref:Outer membrane transport energization protein ExbD n=1 Tax=Roseimicrobium gellanilyticum TaxID=748857 RepID=A0A366H8C3_9BACT|nr:biopolymer transporter ExbD [Roseimicrobium gellanilyticum]RBP37284.1 outer membrane transport energization protein ExbD [Roseimicrobium gellanilyticum]